jgi:hypothetical protein
MTADTQRQVSWPAVCARRLWRHGLAQPLQHATPADAVAAMCGAHAQILSAGELSIGLRLAGATRSDVRDALWREHSLIKTYGPRGTVHLLPARDLPMWTGALSALPRPPGPLPEHAQLSPAQVDALVGALAELLADAELTVDELTEQLVGRVGAWAGDLVMPAFQGMWPRWRQAIDIAAQRGVLCFGPNRGRNVTYTSPHRWLPGFCPAGQQAALGELVERYLYVYGPATPQQFAQWLNAPRQWAAELFDTLAGRIEAVDLDGSAAWVVAGDTDFPDPPPADLHLLPYFDAYVVGSHPRGKLFPGRAQARALAGGQAGNFPVVLIGSVVAGVWHQRRSGRRIAITVEPLEQLSAAQLEALAAQAARVGTILEGTASFAIGTLAVGPHA